MLRYDKKLILLSRQLRKNMTPSEKLVWLKIRMKQVKGYQFYRQKPVGNYIVDFYCPRAKLAIEIDGGQHKTINAIAEDSIRDNYLRNLGLKVLRFNNNDINDNIEAVLEEINSQIE